MRIPSCCECESSKVKNVLFTDFTYSLFSSTSTKSSQLSATTLGLSSVVLPALSPVPTNVYDIRYVNMANAVTQLLFLLHQKSPHKTHNYLKLFSLTIANFIQTDTHFADINLTCALTFFLLY